MYFVQVDGEEREYSEDGCMKDTSGPPSAVAVPESALKISHTSPDIPLESQTKLEKNQVHTLARDRVQRQITEPTSSVRSVHYEFGVQLETPSTQMFGFRDTFGKKIRLQGIYRKSDTLKCKIEPIVRISFPTCSLK